MTLPQTYNEVFKEINARTTNAVANHNRYMARAHEQHEKELNELTHATFEYLNTGIARLDDRGPIHVNMHATAGWGQRGFDWKQYFQALAAEHKRPFVFTSTGYQYVCQSGGYDPQRKAVAHSIVMPTRKYLRPLTGLFALYEETGLVKISHDTKNTHVTLAGDQAPALFQQWLAMVTTDLECRQALRVI